jgi:hypothetical protein
MSGQRSLRTYTPSNDEVRESYQQADDGIDFKSVYYERGREYDRWFAQVRAEALREAADRIEREARADECALHDVARVSDLPELSRVMLNGVTRSAERMRAMAASPGCNRREGGEW